MTFTPISFIIEGSGDESSELDGWNLQHLPRAGETVSWFGHDRKVVKVTHVFERLNEQDVQLSLIEISLGP